jgi:hypothetical protein
MRILISEYEQCDVAGFRGDSVEETVFLDVMLRRWVSVLSVLQKHRVLKKHGKTLA